MKKIKNINLPKTWSVDYLNNFKWDVRPDWGPYHQKWYDIGVGPFVSPRGLRYDFLRDREFIEQGGVGIPTHDNYEITHWWFSKIPPACMIEMHEDLGEAEPINEKVRACTAITDYIPGHVYIENDILWANYKKGDTFLLDNVIHGAANLTLTDKITLQMLLTLK